MGWDGMESGLGARWAVWKPHDDVQKVSFYIPSGNVLKALLLGMGDGGFGIWDLGHNV